MLAGWRQRTGKEGEALAALWFKKKNWKILHTGYRTPYGEIDLVCEDGGEIVFVEVKTRKSGQFGYPEESVTSKKVHHMQKAAQWIVQKEHWLDRLWRLDALAISFEKTGEVAYVHIPSIDAGEKTW
jgi:putative endonuclease